LRRSTTNNQNPGGTRTCRLVTISPASWAYGTKDRTMNARKSKKNETSPCPTKNDSGTKEEVDWGGFQKRGQKGG